MNTDRQDASGIDLQFFYYTLLETRNKVDTIYYLLTKDLPESEKDKFDLIHELHFRGGYTFRVKAFSRSDC